MCPVTEDQVLCSPPLTYSTLPTEDAIEKVVPLEEKLYKMIPEALPGMIIPVTHELLI